MHAASCEHFHAWLAPCDGYLVCIASLVTLDYVLAQRVKFIHLAIVGIQHGLIDFFQRYHPSVFVETTFVE